MITSFLAVTTHHPNDCARLLSFDRRASRDFSARPNPTSIPFGFVQSLKSFPLALENYNFRGTRKFGFPKRAGWARRRGRRENVNDQIANFQLIRKAIPPRGGKKVCSQNLPAKGCPGGANTFSKDRVCHFVPKKSDVPEDAQVILETSFGPLRPDLE